ncbi:MAG: hypothetical protein ACI9BW_000215 [Gammaproteobacteria bacterium]|jgi:uncharacterized protein YidB (DUF937 family)
MEKLGGGAGGLSEGAVSGALGGLLGGGDGNIDLAGIISKPDGGGLANIAKSWLGHGGNDGISAQQILSMFGDSAVGDFASKLNLDKSAATDGLAGMLPDLIDGSSKGGSLLDSVGGAGGLLGMASKFLK